MRFVALELELLDVLFRHLDTCVILICIQDGLNFQSATVTSTANEVHDGFKVDQRLAFPVQADEGKQPVFDLVPLAGSGRIMANGDRHASFITQRLQMQLPGARPAAVAASAISADQQPRRAAVVPFPVQTPPSLDTLGSE